MPSSISFFLYFIEFFLILCYNSISSNKYSIDRYLVRTNHIKKGDIVLNEDRKIKEYLTSLSFGSKSQLLKDDVIFEDGVLKYEEEGIGLEIICVRMNLFIVDYATFTSRGQLVVHLPTEAEKNVYAYELLEDGGLGIMTDDEIVDILGAPLSRLKGLNEESENEEVEEIDEIE